jgi:hypothetical protein
MVVILLVVAIIFGVWAYSGKESYKNSSNQKIAAAVTLAESQQMAIDTRNNNIANQNPLDTYTGPSEYGSLDIQYPKDWSVYMIVASSGDNNSSNPVQGYFQPGIVPDTQNSNNLFALQVEVMQQPYNQVVANFDSQAQSGHVTVNPYSLPKVPSAIGVMVSGQIETNISGSMVVLPLRDTTLEIWTETSPTFNYSSDFTNTILPNFSFSP